MQLDAIAIPYDAVLALMAMLELPGMAGFDITPMLALSKPEFQARANRGSDILEQRGFITINQQTKERVFDDRFSRFFLTSLQRDPSVMIETRQHGVTTTTVFAASDGFVVERSNPPENSNLFLFTHLPTVGVIRSRYNALLEPLRQRSQISATVRQKDMKIIPFQTLMDALHKRDFDEARKQLKKSKWDDSTINTFLNDCQNARLWWAIVQDDTRKPAVFSYYVIETPTQCWLCQPTDPSGKVMSIEAASGQRCADLIAPLISVVEPHAAQG